MAANAVLASVMPSLARIIHDGSLRNRPVASRDGRAEPRRREAYSLQYVDRLSGESARLHAVACRMQARRSSEWAIAAEALMNYAGYCRPQALLPKFLGRGMVRLARSAGVFVDKPFTCFIGYQ